MVANNNPNEIRLIRTYPAPVKLVWEAWNEPEQVAKWWGPRGFTITTHEKDLRPGGIWSYTMHGPDGTDYANKTLYHEVKPYEKLVYDHGGNDDRPPLFRVTVLFSEKDGLTTLDMTMTLPSPEQAENIRKMIKAAGGESTWDRLAEYLDETHNRRQSFVINRSFAATPEELFDNWINSDHLSKWLPPPGFVMTFLTGDCRVGGKSMFKMVDPGMTMYGELQFEQLQRPTRLVYVQRFCDEHGNAARHPVLPLFPDLLRMDICITAEDKQSTRVTLVCQPLGSITTEELDAFQQSRTSMTSGWTNSFDKLEEVIDGAVG